ncbi:hypothetical protein GTA08_BOTSDO02249 [Botryosphaeria dothidea]|uniref:Uncharacterized protein n=1 Tax=Botryosphaeria dothidea TaxID=55169 RepID=A0A8H4IZX6_9PEZI|nr:hypothetical protein GTA08_BOTSDO02249 [Botryosphaeria dothidea]
MADKMRAALNKVKSKLKKLFGRRRKPANYYAPLPSYDAPGPGPEWTGARQTGQPTTYDLITLHSDSNNSVLTIVG